MVSIKIKVRGNWDGISLLRLLKYYIRNRCHYAFLQRLNHKLYTTSKFEVVWPLCVHPSMFLDSLEAVTTIWIHNLFKSHGVQDRFYFVLLNFLLKKISEWYFSTTRKTDRRSGDDVRWLLHGGRVMMSTSDGSDYVW